MKQEKITRFIKTEDADRKWHVIDANDLVLGRLAVKAATIIRGKHKPIFTPNMDTGDFVIVVNAEKVKLTGKREQMKTYFTHSMYPGGVKVKTFAELRDKKPAYIITQAVKGMLPKNKLQKILLKRLKIYSGSHHPHIAQQPKITTI